jgi:MFS family permease
MASASFLGFMAGVIFFPLPDIIGRRATMRFLLIPCIFATGISAYSNSIELKTAAFFLQGVLHVKNMLSFTFIFELVPDCKKGFSAFCITLFDSMTTLILASLMRWVTRDINYVVQFIFILETVFIIVFLYLVPESP